MHAAPDFCPRYAPLQPALPAADGVTYAEYAPAPRLRELIYCYWTLTARGPIGAPLTYRVVADGCIDLFFDLDLPTDGAALGFADHFSLFALQPPCRYGGVRFLPGGFAALCGLPAAELGSAPVPLAAALPALGRALSAALSLATSTSARVAAFDHFFLSRLRHAPGPDPRLRAAVALIVARRGTLRPETDLNVGVSPRQLRRLFLQHVGDTPKALCRVVRFQHLLRAQAAAPADRHLFLDAGYYDQAHFIHEFGRLYGLPPGAAQNVRFLQ